MTIYQFQTTNIIYNKSLSLLLFLLVPLVFQGMALTIQHHKNVKLAISALLIPDNKLVKTIAL